MLRRSSGCVPLLVCAFLVAGMSSGCERVIEVNVHVLPNLPIKKLLVREKLAGIPQGEPQDIVAEGTGSSWQFGLKGRFRKGNYSIAADAYDKRGCLLAAGETESIELETVSLRGGVLSLSLSPDSQVRAAAWCTTGPALGILTGEQISGSERSGGLKGPTDVCWDAMCRTLYVSDTGHHRILGYRDLPEDNLSAWRDQTPSFVIGRSSLDDLSETPVSPPSARTFNSPHGIWCDEGVLLVADTGNHRVLLFAPPSFLSCQDGTLAASGVVGQDGFVSSKPNRQDVGVLRNSLFSPTGVFWSKQRNRLLIADRDNHRVVGYELMSSRDFVGMSGQGAYEVWGQNTRVQADSGSGKTGLSFPTWVAEREGDILVSDTRNARVVVFDGGVSNQDTRAVEAVGALGQPTLEDKMTGAQNNQLNGPAGFRVALRQAFLADRLNHRVLVFPEQDLRGGSFAPSGDPLSLAIPLALDPVLAQTEASPVSAAVAYPKSHPVLLIADEARNIVLAIEKTM